MASLEAEVVDVVVVVVEVGEEEATAAFRDATNAAAEKDSEVPRGVRWPDS